ncbi:hypothetical protein PIB30_030071 [Stylosanthes scabra]|uniref:Uncharacterized protein n=1 Tax=Stylosanthes scabra TaxID=79078 RepID=A0ABU6V9T7_9FABA|nr:hypothetical protein [Stylosanthes scabra]
MWLLLFATKIKYPSNVCLVVPCCLLLFSLNSSPRKKHVFDSGSTTSSLTKILFNEDDLNVSSNKDPFGMDLGAWDEELPIETVVGLKEFDGNEGLDPEFNCDAFLLYESLIC